MGASDKRPAGARKHPAGRRPCFGSGLTDEVALALPSPLGVGVRQKPNGTSAAPKGWPKRPGSLSLWGFRAGLPSPLSQKLSGFYPIWKGGIFRILSYLEGIVSS